MIFINIYYVMQILGRWIKYFNNIDLPFLRKRGARITEQNDCITPHF